MVFGEANIGSSNSGVGKLSNEFCTCIPIIQLHSQSATNWFLGVCQFAYLFLHQHKASCFDVKSKKISNHLSNCLMKELFITMQVFLSCLVIPWCHWLTPSSHGHMAWPQGWEHYVLDRLAQELACFPFVLVWLVLQLSKQQHPHPRNSLERKYWTLFHGNSCEFLHEHKLNLRSYCFINYWLV
jgi:hypothetical protein